MSEYFEGKREIGSCPFCGTSQRFFIEIVNPDVSYFFDYICPCGKYSFCRSDRNRLPPYDIFSISGVFV
jgi:hypothetical protein